METIQDFIRFIEEHQTYCWSCQTPISDISYYGPHDGGLYIGTYAEAQGIPRFDVAGKVGQKVWAYLHCPKCKYDTSFWKVEQQDSPREGPKPTVTVFEEGEEEGKKSADKPWKGVCSHGCWFARKRPCKCKCHRVNHQRGLQSFIDDYNAGFEKNKDFFSRDTIMPYMQKIHDIEGDHP